MRRLTKVFKTLASGAMASAAALALVLPSAAALPPGGAEGSTEGTSSTVTGSVEAGGTLSFSLSGFPAGETVSIKIDDGALDGSDNSVSGTGVVHQQKIGANGSVSGSFVLPSYVKPGTHWLRFLASQDIPESQGGGTKGFTNRSPQFTVTGPASDSGEQGGAGGAAGSNEAAGSAGSGAGGSVAGGNGAGAGAAGGGAGSAGAAGGAPGAGANSGVGAGSQAAPSAGASAKATSGTLKVTASPNAKKKSQPAATTVTTIVAVGQSSKPAFPVLGVSVFAAAVLIGAAAIGAVLLRNRRQAGLAGAAGAAAAGGGAANSAGAGAAGASAGASAGAGASGVGNFPGPAA